MKVKIRKITLSSILSALIVVLIIIGSFFDVLDITVAAMCSLIVYISIIEAGGKYPILVYLVSSVLCFVFSPMTTATLYFVAFFGYYPFLRRQVLKLPKWLRKTLCTLLFNIVMALLMLLFRFIFAMHNEPLVMYIPLIISFNIFFLCFDYLMDMFYFVYIKKIRSKISIKF